MSNPTVTAPAEKTFTSFTKDQGANYAKNRPGFHPSLYKAILDHHTATGGQVTTLVDVGCGPGPATRALAPHFAHAIGIDPSEGMIASARGLGGTTSTTEPIRYEIAAAEDLGATLSPPIEDASVDLLTASTAAHWFDMARFWPAAARVLRPGGTVALWTIGDSSPPPSAPNAAKIQAAMQAIWVKELAPFTEPGNVLAKNLYVDLPLPWGIVPEFDEASFFRREWGPEDTDGFYQGGGMAIDLDTMEKFMSTASPVQRWREVHPDEAGTEKDVAKRMRREIERLLHEAGVEKGKETVLGNLTGVLLMLKKKA